MKTEGRSKEATIRLNENLLRYSAAAGAAFALSNTASASITAVDVTGWSLELSGLSDSDTFDVDLNGDSTVDFTFNGFRSGSSTTYPIGGTYPNYTYTTIQTAFSASISLSAGAGNFVATTSAGSARQLSNGYGVQAALASGQDNNGILMFSYSGSVSYGDLVPPTGGTTTGYFGFSFQSGTDTHYAWLEILGERDSDGRPSRLEVLSGAYESQPGTDIQVGAVPEPASVGLGLGLLALGATGVRRLRKVA